MVRLPDLEERRGLGDVIEGKILALETDLFGRRREAILKGLGLERTEDTQAHGCRNEAP